MLLQSQASHSIWFNRLSHLQGPFISLYPKKMLGLPILPGGHHAGHTLPVSSHHTCSSPAALTHPTHMCEAMPGAKAPLCTTLAE